MFNYFFKVFKSNVLIYYDSYTVIIQFKMLIDRVTPQSMHHILDGKTYLIVNLEQLKQKQKILEKRKRIICGLLWILHIVISIASFTIGTIYLDGNCRDHINISKLHIDIALRTYGIYIFIATHILLFEFVLSHYIKARNIYIACTSICFTILLCVVDIGFTMVILALIFGDPDRCSDESKPLYNLGLTIVIINVVKYLAPLCIFCIPCFRKK